MQIKLTADERTVNHNIWRESERCSLQNNQAKRVSCEVTSKMSV